MSPPEPHPLAVFLADARHSSAALERTQEEPRPLGELRSQLSQTRDRLNELYNRAKSATTLASPSPVPKPSLPLSEHLNAGLELEDLVSEQRFLSSPQLIAITIVNL